MSSISVKIFRKKIHRTGRAVDKCGYIIMNDFTPLYDLKDVELEVVRLRNVPEYGVVGRLLAGFDLP